MHLAETLVMVPLALVGLLAFFVLRTIPWQALSLVFYFGLVLTGLGGLSLIKPWRFLFIYNRWMALGLLLGGLLLMVIGVAWPTRERKIESPRQELDRFMPVFSFYERHETVVRAKKAAVMAAVHRVSLADIPVARRLMALRARLGGEKGLNAVERPILQLCHAHDHGFLVLDDHRDDEFVGGMAGRPWTSDPPPPVYTAADFLAYRQGGHVRVAFNMKVVERGDQTCLLSTETRIAGNDAQAARVFARYWRIIFPGSAIIRQVWLKAIRIRAEQGGTSAEKC